MAPATPCLGATPCEKGVCSEGKCAFPGTSLVVQTVAGDGTAGFADGKGSAAKFKDLAGIAVGPQGTVYLADAGNYRIRKMAPDGTVTTLAGSGEDGESDGPGSVAKFSKLRDVAMAPNGDLIVTDSGNFNLRRVTAAGVVSTVAPDLKPFAISVIYTVAVQSNGKIFFGRRNALMRFEDNAVSLLAGDAEPGFADATGPAARFSSVYGVEFDGNGGLIVADSKNHRLRRVDAEGKVVTIAGTGVAGYADGAAAEAKLSFPMDVAMGPQGSIFFIDLGTKYIRRLGGDGEVTTYAGSGDAPFKDGPALEATFPSSQHIATAPGAVVYVTDFTEPRVRKIYVAGLGCDDNNACTTDTCDSDSGVCAHTDIPDCCTDAKDCDDGDECTTDTCVPGESCSHAPKSCDDGDAFTTDACDQAAGECSHTWSMAAGCAAGGGQIESNQYCVKTDGNGIEWGLVPAGTFWMGCNETLDGGCKSGEKPQHEVTISKPFWLGLSEVTVSEYQKCEQASECEAPALGASGVFGCAPGSIAANWSTAGPEPGRESHPLNCVTWPRAAAYCASVGGSLPTEAQWELAARGRCEENGGVDGCAAKMRVYPWGNAGPTCGKHAVLSQGGASGCGQSSTWAVKTGSQSGRGPYGHYDLAGNVQEWVQDWYSASYYDVSPKQDPENTNSASSRVDRGGSFYAGAAYLRAGDRGFYHPSVAAYFLGVRCARSFP